MVEPIRPCIQANRMSWFSGTTKNMPQPEQRPLGLEPQRLDTNEQARPVPVFWGERRLGITFLSQAFNQKAEAVRKELGKEKHTVGYNYFCAFAAMVCCGPVDKLSAIYFDDVKVWPVGAGTPITRNTTKDKVVLINVKKKGSGYSSATVSISGNGSGATADALIDTATGEILFVKVKTFGAGYSTATATIVGDGEGAELEVVIGSEPSVNITLETGETWTWYWGTPYQYFDPLLESLSSDTVRNPSGVIDPNVPEEHPAYDRQCYFVTGKHALGYNRTSIQNIEVVVSRHPEVSWLANGNIESDCSIPVIVADAMRDTLYGLGLKDNDASDTIFDRTGITTVESTLSSENLAVSPLVSRVHPFTEFMTELLEYVDGYYRATDDGKLTLGLVREVNCDDDSLPIFDENSLADVPILTPDSWRRTHNRVFVVFTNRDNQHKEDATQGTNSGNLKITREPNPAVLQRPWITRHAIADRTARIAAKMFGIPNTRGSLGIRKSKLQSLKPGDGFYLHYDHYSLCWMHCRAIEIVASDPFSPKVEVEFEVDRAYLAEQTVTPAAYVAPSRIVHSPQAFDYHKAFEMPFAPEIGEVPRVAFLAARKTLMTDKFDVHLERETDSYYRIRTGLGFAFRGTLDFSYGVNDTGVVTVTLQGADQTLEAVTLQEANKNKVLALIGDEIMSIYNVTLLSTARYSFNVLRERFDSGKATHNAGAEVWILSSEDLNGIAWKTSAEGSDGEQQKFKLQPYVLDKAVSLSSVTPITLTFTDRHRRPWKPTGFTAPATYDGLSSVSFSWTVNNREVGNFKAGMLRNPTYVLEFYDEFDSLLFTVDEIRANATSYTLTMSELQTYLNPLATFKAKFYAQQRGLNSRASDLVTVTKV